MFSLTKFTRRSEVHMLRWLASKGGRSMATLKKIPLTIVVNGQPTVVDAVVEDPLRSIIEPALRQTGNSGQPPENWEFRDADGSLLDLNKKIEDYAFTDKTRLFLSLKAGVGGCS